MKKQNSFMIALMLACVAALSIYGFCGGFKGKSAYEIAVKNGYRGTEVEWLNSLKGSDGTDGKTVDYEALYASAKASGEIAADTTYLQFIQNYIVENKEDTNQTSLAYSIQNSIKSSVSIFVNYFNGTKRVTSAGAGSIIDIDSLGNALIVTNYHVAYSEGYTASYYILLYEDNYITQSNNIIQAIENDPEKIEANYVGGSKDHDLAVLKVTASDRIADRYKSKMLDKVTFEDSSKDLVVGSDCYAVGNPLGEGMSATQGIVSVAYEQILLEDVEDSTSAIVMRAIRVTCPINGGNSGGGLFNSSGKLIGVINSKRYYSHENDNTIADGVGYAIPLPVVRNVVNKILSDCKDGNTTPDFKRLGISTTIVDAISKFNQSTGLIETSEVTKVLSVAEGSLAESHGLRQNDILNSVSIRYANGTTLEVSLNHYYTLSDLMLTLSSGDKITINYTRAGLFVPVNGSATITF